MRTRLVEFADHFLHEYLDKIDRATAELTEDDLWFRPGERTNAIGNLLLHLRGNIALWILEGLAGVPSHRKRSAEFDARRGEGLAAGKTRAHLIADLRETIERALAAVCELSTAEFERTRMIQTYEEVDGYRALFHVVEHMSYHTGQIVLIAKMRLGSERALEFYPQHKNE